MGAVTSGQEAQAHRGAAYAEFNNSRGRIGAAT